MDEREMLTISGEIIAVIYRDEKKGFGVVVLQTENGEESVIGDLGNAEEGEDIECIGYYTQGNYGRQFRCEHWERSLPSTTAAIQKYLASGIIKGIGKKKAKAIVERFGEATFDVIENDPEMLAEISGIRRATALDISEQFKQQYAVKGLSVFFMQYGIPLSAAVTANRRWGSGAEELIRSNPYLLCGEGLRVSFEKADSVGRSLGIAMDSALRVKAGIGEVLRQEMAESKHTCLPAELLARKSCALLGTDRAAYEAILADALEGGEMYCYEKPGGKFIMLRDQFRAESYISRRLSVMSSLSYDNKIDFSEVIDSIQQDGLVYDEKQREAINLSLSCGFLIGNQNIYLSLWRIILYGDGDGFTT